MVHYLKGTCCLSIVLIDQWELFLFLETSEFLTILCAGCPSMLTQSVLIMRAKFLNLYNFMEHVGKFCTNNTTN